MSETLTPEDLDEIPYPEYDSLEELSTEELVLIHYRSWRSINITEVYGVGDIKKLSAVESMLDERGISFQPSFPQYHIPA